MKAIEILKSVILQRELEISKSPLRVNISLEDMQEALKQLKEFKEFLEEEKQQAKKTYDEYCQIDMSSYGTGVEFGKLQFIEEILEFMTRINK